MAKNKAPNRWAAQAALDAAVRFGPETSGLQALLRQAYENRATGRAQARGTARGTINAIDRARPAVKDIYDNAGLHAAQTARTLIGSDLAGLGTVADSIKGGAALEQKQAVDNMAAERTAALTGLAQQRVGAQVGKGYALRNTQSEFVSEVAKILARHQDLMREQGAFEASEVGKLRESAADRRLRLNIAGAGNAQSERNSLRSAGIDPDTGSAIPGGKLDPAAKPKKGPKPIAAGQQMKLNTDVQSALTLLRVDVDPHKKLGRHAVADQLINGEARQKILAKGEINPVSGKPATADVYADAIKPHDVLAVRVANDMYYDGHLSPATIALLRQNRVRIKAIPGVEIWTPEQRAAQRRKRRQPANHAGNIFTDVLNAVGQ